MGVHTSAAVLDAVIAHARSEAPRECCGMLIGSVGRILEAVPARNLSADPNRFEIDPIDHIAARRRARGLGVDVTGFYHSHPHAAAVPSPTDVSEVTYDGCVYLIVSLSGEPSVRLFRMERAGYCEIGITIDS